MVGRECHIFSLDWDNAKLKPVTDHPLPHLFIHRLETTSSFRFFTWLTHLLINDFRWLLTIFLSCSRPTVLNLLLLDDYLRRLLLTSLALRVFSFFYYLVVCYSSSWDLCPAWSSFISCIWVSSVDITSYLCLLWHFREKLCSMRETIFLLILKMRVHWVKDYRLLKWYFPSLLIYLYLWRLICIQLCTCSHYYFSSNINLASYHWWGTRHIRFTSK